MTAPTLPTALSRLAELLPERVRITPSGPSREARYTHVLVSRKLGWEYVYYDTRDAQGWASHGLGEMWLEAALREEIEARGIPWAVHSLYHHGLTYAAYLNGSPDDAHEADTPAHALALALISALSESE